MQIIDFSKIKTLKNIYLAILGVLFVLIIATPFIINHPISLFDEEFVEAALIFLLFLTAFFIYWLYKKELRKNRNELNEALNYIGSVNVQIDQIKSAFNGIKKYPETKNDFKNILKILANKTLGIINAEWLLLRIIELDNGQTLTEFSQGRGHADAPKFEIGNKDLVADKKIDNHVVIKSTPDNFNLRAYCVLPVNTIRPNQKILVETIINSLGMLYLIFTFHQDKDNTDPDENTPLS